MKRNVKYIKTSIKPLQTYEGEPIEIKVERILTSNEPITDGAPIIYGEKKNGVRAEHDIRTDRWEIAADAMNVVHKSKVAKSEAKAVKKDSGGEVKNETKDSSE